MWLWGLASPKICRVSWQVEYPGKPMVYFYYESWKAQNLERANISIQDLRQEYIYTQTCVCVSMFKAVKQEGFLLVPERAILFIVVRPSTDWKKPNVLERPICLTHSTNSSVNLIFKHSHRHTQNNIWPNVWGPNDPVKLTHNRLFIISEVAFITLEMNNTVNDFNL